MNNTLSSISTILGTDAQAQLEDKLSCLNSIITSSSKWTQKLIEYAKKDFTCEQRNCLEMMFYCGSNSEFFDIFNPTAFFADRIYAIKELEYYLTDDVDISLVMVEFDTTFTICGEKRKWHNRRFALMTNTWYNDNYQKFDFWKDKLSFSNSDHVDVDSFTTSRKCLQEDNFFKLLDVILDKNNLKHVDYKDDNEHFVEVDEDALAKFILVAENA